MNKLNTTGFAADIALELERMHAAAGQVRGLEDLELSWVSGGGDTPWYDNGTPPPTP